MNEAQDADFGKSDLRIPIVLGVSGHIDIRPEDFAVFREAVGKIFRDLQTRFPKTPLVLLSSLAPGGDLLAAEVALKHAVELVVPLPFPPAIYAQSTTFSQYDSERERMLQILAPENLVESFVVPLPDHPNESRPEIWKAIHDDPVKRRTCYANSGGYIVRHCHALVAFWDGKTATKPSGTGEMIDCKLKGAAPGLYPWREPLLFGGENGPVFILHAPRKGSSEKSAFSPGEFRVQIPPNGEILSPEEREQLPNQFQKFFSSIRDWLQLRPELPARKAEWAQFNEICAATEQFNQDAESVAPEINALMTRNSPKSWLLHRVEENILPRTAQRLLLLREKAAAIARKLESRSRIATIALFSLLFLAGLFFDCYAHLESNGEHHPVFVIAFVLCLGIAALVVAAVCFLRLNERRLDYRALAEALRVTIFWGAAGINESVADRYLTQMRNEMSWARRALQMVARATTAWGSFFNQQTHEQQLEQLRLVVDDWIGGQIKFFKSSFEKHHHLTTILRCTGIILALFGWLISLGFIASLCGLRLLNAREPDAIWLIGFGALVLGGGLFIAFCERRSHEELARHYERMTAVFGQGLKEAESHLQSGDIAATQEVLLELGREAISENAQWLILRRTRPLELLVV